MLFSFHDADQYVSMPVKCILPQIYDVYDCKYNRAGRFAVLIDKMNRATVIKAQFQESFVQDFRVYAAGYGWISAFARIQELNKTSEYRKPCPDRALLLRVYIHP